MGEHHVSTEPALECDVIRVAIVDDHPLARRGLEQILSESSEIRVTASVASVAELAGCGEPFPDVVLLDLYPGSDVPCLPAIGELGKAMRVLVISASGRPADVLGAIRAGAAGYLTKSASPEMIVSALETVAAGGFSLSSQLADILQSELLRPQQPKQREAAPLSPREEEALSLIARGFTHGQAATRMGVSKATVDTYVERIRAKLQVGNKAELTRAALERLTQRPASP